MKTNDLEFRQSERCFRLWISAGRCRRCEFAIDHPGPHGDAEVYWIDPLPVTFKETVSVRAPKPPALAEVDALKAKVARLEEVLASTRAQAETFLREREALKESVHRLAEMAGVVASPDVPFRAPRGRVDPV